MLDLNTPQTAQHIASLNLPQEEHQENASDTESSIGIMTGRTVIPTNGIVYHHVPDDSDFKKICLWSSRTLLTLPTIVIGTACFFLHGFFCALLLSFEVICFHCCNCCIDTITEPLLCSPCLRGPCEIAHCCCYSMIDTCLIMTYLPLGGFIYGGYKAFRTLWGCENLFDGIQHERSIFNLTLLDTPFSEGIILRFNSLIDSTQAGDRAEI